MSGIVKLVFQTIASGSGLADVSAQTAKCQKQLGKMAQGATVLGRAFGVLGGTVGRSLGMLLQGGIWGSAAELAVSAIGKITEKWKEHNKLLRDARLAARGMSAEYRSAEYQAQQYQKRVEKWRKAAADAAKAEADAQAQAKTAAERREASAKKAVSFEQQYYALEDQIAMEKARAGLESEDENVRLRTRVKLMLDAAKAETADARRGVATANANGDGYDVDVATQRLRLAEARQANAVAAARKLVEEHRKAKQLAEDEAQARLDAMLDEDFKAEEARRRREEGERKMAEIRQAAAEAVERIEGQIAAKRKEAADLEANASRARGVSFGDWARGERDLERGERAAARKQANRERAVDDEIARIEGMSPRARSKWHRDRLAKLKTWKANQDPGNNPAAAEAADLEKKRDEILKEQNAKLDKIASLLEGATTI